MKYILIALVITAAGAVYFVLRSPDAGDFVIDPALVGEETRSPQEISKTVKDNSEKQKTVRQIETKNINKSTILFEVPFTAQAPFGNWDNIVYQQACEEASVLMAMMWAQGRRGLSAQSANDSIQILADFEQKNYGEFRDTSARDTAAWAREYFNYQNLTLVSDIDTDGIIEELESGNIVIVPVNGQLLANPFFTPPGPIQHMILVRGYDYAAREFITNDPGTKNGNGYRYTKTVLENALQDYPTGFKEPIPTTNKRMIIIGRQ